MQRQPVNSTDIKSVGYDADSQKLVVEFIRGFRVYVYYGVPEQVYQELMAAPSIGHYFHKNIRQRYAGEIYSR